MLCCLMVILLWYARHFTFPIMFSLFIFFFSLIFTCYQLFMLCAAVTLFNHTCIIACNCVCVMCERGGVRFVSLSLPFSCQSSFPLSLCSSSIPCDVTPSPWSLSFIPVVVCCVWLTSVLTSLLISVSG